jgi:hypothetical protein
MLGTQKVGVLFSKLMAAKTTLGRLLSREASEANDFVRIGRLSVCLARPVATFAALPLHAMLIMQSFPVRSLVERLANIFVTSFAGIGTNVL